MFSIKMRASKKGNHISGAETIVDDEKYIELTTNEFIKRALSHENGVPDFINIKIEKIDKNEVIYINHLPIKTINCKNKEEARKIAKDILKNEGINVRLKDKKWTIL